MGRYKWSKQEEILLKLLKQLRVDAGMTQRQPMVKLNRPQSYVSKYESGEKRLDILELKELCDACGVSLAEFTKKLEQELDAANTQRTR